MAGFEDAIKEARLLAKRGETERAKQLFEAVLARAPEHAGAKEGIAELTQRSAAFEALSALYQKGEFLAVLAEGESLIAHYPDAAFLQNMLGAAHAGLQQWEKAAAFYKKGIRLRPDIAQAHVNLGKCLSELKHYDEAVAAFSRALQLKPAYADAHYSLGIVLSRMGRTADAVAAFSKAVAIRPDFAEAYNNLGIALSELDRPGEAVRCYRQALRLGLETARTYTNLGAALNDLGRYDESIAAFDKALSLEPGVADTRAQKLYQQALICDWESLAQQADVIPKLGIEGSPVRPFVMLPLEDDPHHHRQRAERFSHGKFPQQSLWPFPSPAADRKELRIGYFSANFHDHPVMHMIARLFERHDRTRFRLYAYSYGPPSEDDMRARAKASMDFFRDVRTLRDREVAELARKDGIDIAVDLMGHTEGARTEIFAYRAAPIQIAYLGYPGTMGADFMDYLVADQTLVPDGDERHYTESLILLPGSFMPGDETRVISDRLFSRAEMGLPDAFVFCCFNNSYKISATEFDIWMRLLRQVEKSVLWLSKPNEWAMRNLRKEAERRGVEPQRIVFAERLAMAEHLARYRLADLFLDTFHYNAHSTASDALWAGLPLITKAGRGLPARVGASLLKALELPELIADSKEAYEQLALAFALDPKKLAELKAKLWQKRQSAPLFDSRRFARHMEAAYLEAYRRYGAGEKLTQIVVS